MLKPRISLLQKKAFWSTFWGRREGEYYRGFKIEKNPGENTIGQRFESIPPGEGASWME